MANFILSYDLNGPHPNHKEMDAHLEKIGVTRGRILETVWYVAFWGTAEELFNLAQSILGREDRLFVAEVTDAAWDNLLIRDDSLIETWQQNRAA